MNGDDDIKREGGFLSGWSKRKLAVKRQEAEAQKLVEAELEETLAKVDPDEPPSEVIDEEYIASLPSLDEITSETDIKPFLMKGVPAQLKNAAMRRLWMATPGVRDYSDPAVDYAWDWNAPGGVPGGGGTLSETGVNKMVKDLLGERHTVAQSEGESEVVEGKALALSNSDGTETDMQTVTQEERETGDEPTKSVRRTDVHDADNQKAVTTKENGDASKPQSTALEGLLPSRRHGGAIPT